MIQSSFCCFKGISQSAEQRLWQNGCLTWHYFLNEIRLPLSQAKSSKIAAQIKEAQIAYESELWDYFIRRFPVSESIRIFSDIKKGIGYLDIETTGLSKQDNITTLALYVDGELYIFIKGRNLSEFLEWIPRIKLIITYNGMAFDIPFIERHFRMDLNIPHIDLMPVLKKRGLHGGLKQSCKKAGITRQINTVNDGKHAIDLWEKYSNLNNAKALHQLVLYNAEDAIILEQLAVWAYNRSMEGFPLHKRLPMPQKYNVHSIQI